ncbi:hypothetical protein L218DRAFT_1007440 [Marasmius fiardii PR-910]|nr:hypothetical protein L218DRAFT_1007440 [Marasmius fiardii PR-910]
MRQYGIVCSLLTACLSCTAFPAVPTLPSVVPTRHAAPFNNAAIISRNLREVKVLEGRQASVTLTPSLFTSVVESTGTFSDSAGAPTTGTRTFTIVGTTFIPESTSFVSDGSPSSSPSKSMDRDPIVIGSVVGGITFILFIALLIFLLIRRRHRNRSELDHHADVTPFVETDEPGYTDITERKAHMIGQREMLERQLEEYEHASWHSREDYRTSVVPAPDSTLESIREDATNRALCQQLAILTQRIAALEVEIKPPQYTSDRGSNA